jgi:pseudouridine synthase
LRQGKVLAQERLQKILASAGVASRRKSEGLILEGLVEVNGEVVTELPVFADREKDTIKVRGKKIKFPQRQYWLLNKPKNVICTNRDPRGRTKAVDLIPSDEKLVCVGRLDTDTTGLIILTNDNELANKLTHPRYEVPKTYAATVKGRPSNEQIEKVKKGVRLSEGHTGPAVVKVLKRGRGESLIELTIRKGLKRQIRRTLGRVGLPVKSLKRTRIGPVTDKGIGVGKCRELAKKEVDMLRKTAES